MIATSTTFPIILAEIGFVGIVAGIATAVIICIVMSLDKKDEDGKIFGLDASGVCTVIACFSIFCAANAAATLTHTSKPQTVNESIVYYNQLDAQVQVEAYNLSINTDSTDIVPDVRDNYKNGNYDNDGTITLTKDHVSTSRKFDDIAVSGPKDAVAIKQMKLVDTETKTRFLWWTQTDSNTTLHITFSYVNVTDPQVKDLLDNLIGRKVK
jgi:hypothetical protein